LHKGWDGLEANEWSGAWSVERELAVTGQVAELHDPAGRLHADGLLGLVRRDDAVVAAGDELPGGLLRDGGRKQFVQEMA
jgi:hypothetical protein